MVAPRVRTRVRIAPIAWVPRARRLHPTDRIMLASFFALAVLFQPSTQLVHSGPSQVDYTVSAHDATGVEDVIPVHVTMTIHRPHPRTIVEIPVWTPGSYRLRVFPDRIHEVAAKVASGADAPVLRIRRNAWEVQAGTTDKLVVSYRVDLHGDDRFMLRGDKRRCITYEGPAVYMYVRGHHDVPSVVDFDLADGWSAASGLDPRPDGTFYAQTYDFLADCPVKLGVFQTFAFESHGKPIRVIVDGPGDVEFDSDAWVANIKKICDCQGDLFGGMPFEHYTFLYTASPGGEGGGLEHLTSTAIGVRTRDLRNSATAKMSTTAHEFFHVWNVKRLRPVELGPFDYSRPNRTTGLWLMEGVTSYYTEVTLARTGITSEEAFWRAMARQIGGFEGNPARHHLSSGDSSYRAWDSVAFDRNFSYYNSGLVMGLLLDLEIRARTENRRSLDDAMRALFGYCQTLGRGLTEAEITDVFSQVAGSDLTPFFDRHVHGTVVPPYADILAHAGVEITLEERSRRVLRGLQRTRNREGLYWATPDARSAAGTMRNSGAILELDGTEIGSNEDLQGVLEKHEPGTQLTMVIEGPLGRRTVRVPVDEARTMRISNFAVAEKPTALAMQIRNGIVTGVPGNPRAR